MINSKKKGFTIVELVIVIAVVAILAAVLIPTFSNLVKKANISADQQAVVQMNKLLTIDEVADPQPTTADGVVEVLIKNGYADDLTTYYSNYQLAWIKESNVIVLVENGAVVYPEKYKGATEFEELKPMIKDHTSLMGEISSSTEGKTIFLSENINEMIRVASPDVNVSINMNGNTITNNSNNAVAVLDGIVELKNGTIKSGGSDYHAVATTGSSTVTLDNVNIIGQNDPSKLMLAVKTYSSDTTINIKNSVMTLINCGGVAAESGGTINLENVIISRSGDAGLEFIETAIAVSGNGTVNVNGGKYSGVDNCLYVYSSGGTINVTDGEFIGETVITFTLDKNTYPDAVSEMYISGGKFDGLINVVAGCKLEISGGTFTNTGLTLDEFKTYVKSGHTVETVNGAFVVK